MSTPWPARRVGGIAFVLSLSMAALLPAQRAAPGTIVEGDAGMRLDSTVTRSSGTFWGVVLVAIDGTPVLAKGYGFADRLKTPMSPRHAFDLGGASQFLTRVLALRLVADGKLELDDRVQKHLPDWPVDKAGMTVREVFTHRSGLPPTAALDGPAATVGRNAMLVIAHTTPVDRIGAAFHYSDLNATLLALVLEAAGQQKFDRLLVDRVFRAANMAKAAPGGVRIDSKIVTSRRSDENERGEPADRLPWPWSRRGASGVLASAFDVHELLLSLAGNTLLDAPQQEPLWQSIESPAFGIGNLPGSGNLLRVSGGAPGYRTRWIVQRSSRSWIVILTEDYGSIDGLESALVTELQQAIATSASTAAKSGQAAGTTPSPSASAASEQDRFVGTFELPRGGGRFRITKTAGGLQLSGEGLQGSVRVREGRWPPAGEDRLRRLEDRGLAILQSLVGPGGAANAGDFADAAVRESLDTLLREWSRDHGPVQTCRYVGSQVDGKSKPGQDGAESWFRVVAAKDSLLLRVSWAEGMRWRQCTRVTAGGDGEPPFVVALQTLGGDTAGAAAADGRQLLLTMEGSGEHRCLVFEDESSGDTGLIECAVVVGDGG